jgi:hypothetical protein
VDGCDVVATGESQTPVAHASGAGQGGTRCGAPSGHDPGTVVRHNLATAALAEDEGGGNDDIAHALDALPTAKLARANGL